MRYALLFFSLFSSLGLRKKSIAIIRLRHDPFSGTAVIVAEAGAGFNMMVGVPMAIGMRSEAVGEEEISSLEDDDEDGGEFAASNTSNTWLFGISSSHGEVCSSLPARKSTGSIRSVENRLSIAPIICLEFVVLRRSW